MNTQERKEAQADWSLFFSKKMPAIFFSPTWQKIIPPSFLALLTIIFYYPSLWHPFQFDDLANITKNFNIRFVTFSNIWRAMYHNSRWMADAINGLCFKISRFDPLYYRLTNLVIHILAGLILFFLILDLCSHLKKNHFVSTHAILIATLTSGLFLLHPVQTQTVSYVIQARLEGIATLFILAIVFIFTKALRSTSLLTKGFLFFLAFILGFLACGTKEIVVVTPFLVILVDWLFIAQESWDHFKYRLLIYGLFGAVVIGTIVFFLDLKFLKDALTLSLTTPNNRGNILTDHAYDTIKALPYFISQFKVILHYLIMFAWPFGMCVEYDWKLSKSFFAADAFFPFIILISLALFALFSLIKKRNSVVSFGLLWFFISVAPRSSIIPSPELICDYKTYLASVGVLFIIALSLTYLFSKAWAILPSVKFLKLPHVSIGGGCIIFLIMGYSTWQRNKVWESPLAFWSDIVKKAPNKARGYNNLGVALAEMGKTDEAIENYLKAIHLDQYYTDPYNNLAVGYTSKNELDKAILALNQAIALFPYYAEAYNNRGTLYLKKKEYQAAENDLSTAIKIRSHYGKAHLNLGRLYLEKGEHEKAWVAFKNATQADLDDVPHGFHTAGQLSLQLKKYPEAVSFFEKMVATVAQSKNMPNKNEFLSSGLFNLANSYFMIKEYGKAESIYLELIKKEPLDPRYTHNLGETYFTQGKIAQALSAFNRARSLPTTLPQTHLRMVNCLEKCNKINEAKTYLESLLKVTAPDEFKKVVHAELTRLTLQDKLNKGNGKIKLSDIHQATEYLDHVITPTHTQETALNKK